LPRSALYLIAAILCEVLATSSLKASNGFRSLVPSLVVVVGYGASFFLLSLALKTIPLGVAYAIWSGIGTALLALVGFVAYKQAVSPLAGLGITLTVAGVVLINLGSPDGVH
jgi:small multidrug resistance pump